MNRYVYFNWFYDPSKPHFARLKNVLLYSLNKYNKDLIIIEKELECPTCEHRTENDKKFQYLENIHKTQKWNEFFQSLNIGDEVLFLDADILILNNISEMFDFLENKEIILTTRNYKKLNFNAGVILFKVTENTKRFFNEWTEKISKFSHEIRFNQEIIKLSEIYLGAGQTTLAYMIEKEEYKNIIDKVPCHIWNCCQQDWDLYTDETKIIHVKSGLRKLIFEKSVRKKSTIIKLAKIWLEYENEMIESDPEKYKDLQINNTQELNKEINNMITPIRRKKSIKIKSKRRYW